MLEIKWNYYCFIRFNNTDTPLFVFEFLSDCKQVSEQMTNLLVFDRDNRFARFVYHSTLAINGYNCIFSMVIRIKAECANTIIILRFNDNSSIWGFVSLFAITRYLF